MSSERKSRVDCSPTSARAGQKLSRNVQHIIGQTSSYNHAIGGLMLSEAYATSSATRAQQLQPVIEDALKVTLELQAWPKRRQVDRGGWRYLDPYGSEDSGLVRDWVALDVLAIG